MLLARGVDHCRAGDDAHRIPFNNFDPEQPLASGLELAMIFAPALVIMSRIRNYKSCSGGKL